MTIGMLLQSVYTGETPVSTIYLYRRDARRYYQDNDLFYVCSSQQVEYRLIFVWDGNASMVHIGCM